jgi:hypothetical protein
MALTVICGGIGAVVYGICQQRKRSWAALPPTLFGIT